MKKTSHIIKSPSLSVDFEIETHRFLDEFLKESFV